MRKYTLILMVSAVVALSSCGSGSTTSTETKDSTSVTQDTVTSVKTDTIVEVKSDSTPVKK